MSDTPVLRVSPEVIAELAATRPAVLLVGGFGAFTVVLMLGAAPFLALGFSNTPELPWLGLVLAGTYLALAALYAPPVWWLLRYGQAIGALSREPTLDALARTLAWQHRFWRYVGVLVLVLVALYVLLIVGIVALAGLGAALESNFGGN